MGGFAFYGSYYDDDHAVEESLFQISTKPRHNISVPKYYPLIYIMKHFPHIFTDITEEYILDQAASSGLSKALLIVQVAWFCTNCASRIFEGLPLSLLEVSTAAHAFCTLLTYFVWWSKPINVAAPTILREKKAQEVYALLQCWGREYDEALEIAQQRAAGNTSTPTGTSRKLILAAGALQHLLPTPERPPTHWGFIRNASLVPGSFDHGPYKNSVHELLSLAFSPILYGLMHFLAWNEHFPTPLESLLWRVSAFVVTFSGLVGIAGFFVFDLLKEAGFTIISNIWGFVGALIIPIAHILASGFLIGESFRQLFFLDPAAYQLPSWSRYWPRLS